MPVDQCTVRSAPCRLAATPKSRAIPPSRRYNRAFPLFHLEHAMRLSGLMCTALSIGVASAGGCTSSTETTAAAEAPSDMRRYDARAFFTTTSYGLAGGYAWSP